MERNLRRKTAAHTGPPRHPRAIGRRTAGVALASAIAVGLGAPHALAQQGPTLPSPDPAPTPPPAAPQPSEPASSPEPTTTATATVQSTSPKPAPAPKPRPKKAKPRPAAVAPYLHPPDPGGAPALDRAARRPTTLAFLDDPARAITPTSSTRAEGGPAALRPLAVLASIALAFGLLALAALPSRALRHFPVVVIDHRFDLACAGLAIAGGVAIGLLIGLSSS